ncbi:condensation domain-containing protein, partial [Pseudomonas sp. 3A(2025)]
GGVVEYAGRIDHQVKIRGFRIELGEIEARVKEHPAVRETVVLDVDGPLGKQLVAWLVPMVEQADEAEQAALRESLREALKAVMPDYMVPAHFVCLNHLPLTANGKLDRKALPAPDAGQQQQRYVAPQSELEQQVAAIWAEVLQIERVGLTDNFFELGGHSLLATQVISRVRQVLEVELPLRVLFEAPVLSSFIVRLAEGVLSQAPAFTPVDRQQPLLLSYAQQRQWFLWQLDPDSPAYNIPVVLRFKGPLDRNALHASFDALIARHETLRTTFRQSGEHALQIIHDYQPLEVVYQALASEVDIQNYVEAQIQRPFDLVNGPLLRVKLLKLAEDDHVLVLTLHHIVSDGWSMPVMVDELVSLYEGHRLGDAVSLPAMPIQYADYAAWQRHWMEAGEQARQLAYWHDQLGGEQPVLELPLDRPRPLVRSHDGASLNIRLEAGLTESLNRLARQQGVTLFMVLLASFQTLLHRYSGQRDIRVGVPTANRNRVETERLIGFFVNTQVLKADFDVSTTFGELLQQVKAAALGAQVHQDLPFEQLVEALQPERSLSHSPLFQVMFNHQAAVNSGRHTLPGLTVEGVSWDSQTAQFDLTLDTSEAEHELVASLIYATALFDASTIERMARHWVALLEQVVIQPTQRLTELSILSADEYRQIVHKWNRTEVSYPAKQCIHLLIEQQVEKTPQAPALLFGEQSLSYTELNQRANRLAHKLRELGVGPDVLVGIAVERSLEMVVGLLAILKAGG